jgi:hypothetical protein
MTALGVNRIGLGVHRRLRLKPREQTSSPRLGVADEYLANLRANGAAEITVSKNRWLLEDLAAPIRNRPVNEVLPAELLDILKKIEASGRRDTAMHQLPISASTA